MNLVSFDVFDTCLARLCGDASGVFNILSLKVLTIMNEGGNEYLRQSFVAARMSSEGYSLEEIYQNMAQVFPLPCSVEEMAQLEMETEKDLLVPIASTRDLIDKARKNARIVFISDMYLPDDFIRNQLVQYGFFKEGDRIYVSDSVKAWKHDGSLFRLIHDTEGIAYRNWDHYGDNKKSDYDMPRRLGIRAHLVRHGNLPYETCWRNTTWHQYPYAPIMAGLSRAIRLQCIAPESQSAFVCDIAAPLVISWICRVMEDACRRGIKRLYFFARDMHSIYLAAKELRGFFPDLEIHYLFVSSQALYEANTLTLEYFKQKGLADNTVPTAIVDSHSRGGSIVALNHLLASGGYRNVKTYCLVGSIQEQYREKMLPDCDFEFYQPYNKVMGQRKHTKVYGMHVLFEDVFSLNYHQRTVGYERHLNTIRPILVNDADSMGFSGTEVRQMKRTNDLLLKKFAQGYAAMGLVPLSRQILETITKNTFVDFVSYPRQPYLTYLHEYQFESRPFVGKVYSRQRPVWKRGSIVFSMPDFLWKYARRFFHSPF